MNPPIKHLVILLSFTIILFTETKPSCQEEQKPTELSSTRPSTQTLPETHRIKFIGTNHELDNESDAHSSFQTMIMNVTKHPIKIDVLERYNNEGDFEEQPPQYAQFRFELNDEMLELVKKDDCPREQINELFKKLINEDGRPARQLKLKWADLIGSPKKITIEWLGLCADNNVPSSASNEERKRDNIPTLSPLAGFTTTEDQENMAPSTPTFLVSIEERENVTTLATPILVTQPEELDNTTTLSTPASAVTKPIEDLELNSEATTTTLGVIESDLLTTSAPDLTTSAILLSMPDFNISETLPPMSISSAENYTPTSDFSSLDGSSTTRSSIFDISSPETTTTTGTTTTMPEPITAKHTSDYGKFVGLALAFLIVACYIFFSRTNTRHGMYEVQV